MTDDAGELRRDLIKEIGLMAYKFLITLNSGAFIVLLTFIGNASNNERFQISLDALKMAMGFFLLAITLTFVSMTIAYISAQLSLLDKSLPFASSTIGHMIWLALPVALAFASFVIGVICAMTGIS